MKPISTNFLIDVLLSKYKIYRYFLLIKLLQKYFPELQNQSGSIKETIIKNWKQKPYSILSVALIVVAVLSWLMKRKII